MTSRESHKDRWTIDVDREYCEKKGGSAFIPETRECGRSVFLPHHYTGQSVDPSLWTIFLVILRLVTAFAADTVGEGREQWDRKSYQTL